MAFFNSKHCPFCGKKLGFLNTVKIKDGVGICNSCFFHLDIDLEIAKFQTIENLSELLAKRNANYKTFQNFNTTREVKAGGLYFREDNKLQLWYFTYDKTATNPTLYRYDEIIDFELLEDGNIVTSGGIGRALVGGVLFGGAGAIVGAITGKKESKKIINSLSVIITLNNPYRNNIKLNWHNAVPCQSGGIIYNNCMREAQELISFLNSMSSRASAPQLPPLPSVPSTSPADEILKYKELLDRGIITEQEFETKKKHLLGL